MKDITTFINEASVHFKWNCKDISQNDFIKIAKEALKTAKTTAAKIQDEVSQYEDPDDLWNAYERGDLYEYSDFEKALEDALANNPKYKNKKDEIMDYYSSEYYDILDLL